MKAKIIEWNEHNQCHRVIDGEGRKRFMDVTVNGDLPESITNEELIGRTIDYEHEHPYVAIAAGVSLTDNSFISVFPLRNNVLGA